MPGTMQGMVPGAYREHKPKRLGRMDYPAGHPGKGQSQKVGLRAALRAVPEAAKR
jgi:hypothetical protein